MKKIIKTLFISSLILYSSFSFAVTGEEALNSFRQHMAGINKISGLISISTGSGAMYTGVFKYARPGKLYLKFSNPTGRTLVTNGKKLWVYNAGSKICGMQEVTPNSFSGGLAYLTKGYPAIVTGQSGNGCTIKLKNEAKTYPEILLSLDSNFFPKKAVFKNHDGGETTFTISNVNYSPDFIDSIFDYNIPANAQVVKNPLNIK